MSEIITNSLPVKTWHFLNVNEAKLEWNPDHTNNIKIDAAAGETKYQYIEPVVEAGKQIEVRVKVEAAEDSLVKVVLFDNVPKDSTLLFSIDGNLAKNARVELIQLYIGKGNVYSDNKFELIGDKSSFGSEVAYLGQGSQNIDINYVINQYGKKTDSKIYVAGALRDAATKTFKGTIDFKKGSTNSTGDELENVLMLGDDVVNKTVPLILCAEENVAGNHGATIGELDEQTLFYMESRGIDKDEAERIMATAAIERLIRMIDDEKIQESMEKALMEVL